MQLEDIKLLGFLNIFTYFDCDGHDFSSYSHVSGQEASSACMGNTGLQLFSKQGNSTTKYNFGMNILFNLYKEIVVEGICYQQFYH